MAREIRVCQRCGKPYQRKPNYQLIAPPVEQAKTEVRTSFVLDGSCPTCQALAKGEMCPPHDASPRCESGKRNHCSCDVCF